MTRTVVENVTLERGFPPSKREAVPSVKAGMPGEWSIGFWHRTSLRSQILSAIVLANLVAGVLASMVIINDARHAARIEIDASMRMAEQFVLGTVERYSLDSDRGSVLARLAMQVGDLRHVRIHVVDANGTMPLLLPTDQSASETEGPAGAPAWFKKLVQVEDIRREMKIGLNGRRIGSVILIGDADDEIAEVWNETRKLFAIGIVLNLAIFTILYFALGRLLHPLARLDAGLRQLEEGQFRHRLPRPRVKELVSIAHRFNALADRLAAVKADNGRLTRRLVTVQDDERRDVATELHDEIGPCLFGIKANVASLEQFAAQLPDRTAGRMRERVAVVGEIADKIQVLNRQLLNRIRPMALGHVPLEELLAGVVADFQRLHPELDITFDLTEVQHSYGDTIDLTIYRCLQEGLNNVVRHAGAKSVIIALNECFERGAAGNLLHLTVQDDGRGIATGALWGFGLTSMDERIRALGGSLAIRGESSGTTLEIGIPVDDVRRQASTMQKRSERL